MSETQIAPQVTGRMFLFERPELLSREVHGHLGLDFGSRPFDFCAKARAVPLTISEVVEASRHYPVVFSSADAPMPLAILGIFEDVNLLVDDSGMWEANAYVPGYLRRYPFATANETGTDRFAVIVDAAFGGLKTTAERRMFDGAEMTEYMRAAIDFVKVYEEDRRRTEVFMEELKKHDLLRGQTAEYAPQGAEPGSAQPFAQYFGVDAERLAALPDAQFLELRRSNLLPVLYAQLTSLTNWRALLGRRMRRYNITEQEAVRPRQMNS